MPWLSVNHTRLSRLTAVPIPLFALDVQRAGEPGHPGANGSDCAAPRVTCRTGLEWVITAMTDESPQKTRRDREGASGYLTFSIAFIVGWNEHTYGNSPVVVAVNVQDFAA
jgi:hypothetical protein